LISAGALDFWPTFAWAVAGAVLGDGLSFFIGRHFQDQLRGFWPFSRHPDMLQGGIDFFQRYGGKSVVFGRFVGPVRAVIPLVAGMLNMSPGRFLAANIASALAWAPAYLLPGMVFGASLELASEVALRLVVLLVLLIVLLWFVAWLVKRSFRIIRPRSSAWLSRLLVWSELHPKLGEIGAALADPGHPESKGLTLFASLLLLATVLFVLLLTASLGGLGGLGGGLDQTLLQTLQSLRTPWADHLMVGFTRLADLEVMLSLAAAVIVLLASRRHWQTLNHWLAAIAFGLLAAPLLKHLVQIPRPDSGIPGLGPFGFPSAHVMRATVLYGFLSVLIARALSDRWRWLPYTLTGLAVASIAISRLYLGVHWLSDVLASLTLGLIWVAALGIAYHRHTRLESHWPGLTGVAFASLALSIGTLSWLQHDREVARYTPQRPQHELAADYWWQSGWAEQPLLRRDTRAAGRHPLNVQYAGSLEDLSRQLANRGWRPAEQLDWHNALRLLSPSLALQELPVAPQVHDGRHESLALEKSLPDGGRLVLRLWPSDLRLLPGKTPLWLGSVSSQQQRRLLKLLNYPQTQDDYAQALSDLLRDVSGLPQRLPQGAAGPLLLRLDD
jgi:undecaprenyl-diphosphatase